MYYSKDGYIDVDKLYKEDKNVFKFIIGARGIGKTFGELRYWIDKVRGTGNKIVLMRRTQTQIDLIKTPELNPFLALEYELGSDYKFILKSINKNITGCYLTEYDPENNTYIPKELVCYLIALSTISNIRGFAGNDIVHVIYDEFTGELHERPISNEGTAFLNAIETIGRNRELKGIEPLSVTCLSNSTMLANPIFIELKLVTACEKALNKKKDSVILPDRLVSIYMLHDSPISKAKAKTSLYKLAGNDSNFSAMSLHNDFNAEYFDLIKSKNLKEYKPLCAVGEIVIYKHKSKREWYVSEHYSGHPERYASSDIELKRWSNNYYYLKLAHLNRHIYFESYIQQVLFEKYMNI